MEPTSTESAPDAQLKRPSAGMAYSTVLPASSIPSAKFSAASAISTAQRTEAMQNERIDRWLPRAHLGGHGSTASSHARGRFAVRVEIAFACCLMAEWLHERLQLPLECCETPTTRMARSHSSQSHKAIAASWAPRGECCMLYAPCTLCVVCHRMPLRALYVACRSLAFAASWALRLLSCNPVDE